MVGFEPAKLLVKDAVKIGFFFYLPNRALVSDVHFVAKVLFGKDASKNFFALAVMVRPCGVVVVYAFVVRGFNQFACLFFVDVFCALHERKPHAAES